MPIEFRDNNESAPRPSFDNKGDDAMQELRDMFKRETSGDPLSDDEIKSRFGDDALQMVGRVQDRLGELVNAMHDFNIAQHTPGGDVAGALMKFTSLLTQTTQRYNSMEIASMLATGIAAIAEVERREAQDKSGDEPDED